jgi:peptidoglycan hydrolase CwlO-like protein
MTNKYKKPIFWLFLLLALPCFLFGSKTMAETSTEQLQSIDSQRAALEKQLSAMEAQIKQYEKDLKNIGAQKNTLANKIKQLKIKQAQLTLQIEQATLRIDDLEVQLLQTQAQIGQNQRQTALLKNQLGEIVNQVWRAEQISGFDMLVSTDNFSKFYDRLHALEVVGDGLGQILQSLKMNEQDLLDSRQKLDDKQQEQFDYLALVNLQKEELTGNIKSQNTLLVQTKGKEENYQNSLKKTKQDVAEIRNRIYTLLEVGKQITFGQAVETAQWASKQTGVRAAMLLAVLTQESNLGRNVGTCNRKGDPPSKSWKVIMKPTRDQEPFKQITSELGMDIDTTPVSCPMRDKTGKQIGWGGAMGPAQFIPSTWMGYRTKVTAITGVSANPWDIRDAFLASAIKLAADGATTKSGEWTAAMKYFSGSTNTAFRFYGDNVVATADKYQADIDELNN